MRPVGLITERRRTYMDARAQERAPHPANDEGQAMTSMKSFPIVGVGASAGGLESLERFFKSTPASSDMATGSGLPADWPKLTRWPRTARQASEPFSVVLPTLS